MCSSVPSPDGWFPPEDGTVNTGGMLISLQRLGWGGGGVDRPRCLNNTLHLPKDLE